MARLGAVGLRGSCCTRLHAPPSARPRPRLCCAALGADDEPLDIDRLARQLSAAADRMSRDSSGESSSEAESDDEARGAAQRSPFGGEVRRGLCEQLSAPGRQGGGARAH